jgi:hypothetical protein
VCVSTIASEEGDNLSLRYLLLVKRWMQQFGDLSYKSKNRTPIALWQVVRPIAAVLVFVPRFRQCISQQHHCLHQREAATVTEKRFPNEATCLLDLGKCHPAGPLFRGFRRLTSMESICGVNARSRWQGI